MNKPIVSVSITAYNHEQMLPIAIESVLRQEVDFPIEIVIGEDCSKDETASIARAYQQKYPNVIRLNVNETNQGCQSNTYQTLNNCKGKYTAWLDADDFWTDPRKLARQVAALEADPTLMICCHYVRWVTPQGEVRRSQYPDLPPGRYGIEDILRKCLIATPSAMFRTGIHRLLPLWYLRRDAPLSDWPLWVMAAQQGDILLLGADMADYVLAPNSELTAKGDLHWYATDARFYDCIEPHIPEALRPLLRAERGKRYENMMFALCDQERFAEARWAALRAFVAPGLTVDLKRKSRVALSGMVRNLRAIAKPIR